jgi:hypothetical protein
MGKVEAAQIASGGGDLHEGAVRNAEVVVQVERAQVRRAREHLHHGSVPSVDNNLNLKKKKQKFVKRERTWTR